MPRRRLAVALLPVLAALIVLPACGGGDGGGSGTTRTAVAGYDRAAGAVVQDLRALGREISSTIAAANQVPEPVLAEHLAELRARSTALLARLRALDVPAAAAERRVDALVVALGRFDGDLGRLASAAADSDPTSAREATLSLSTDATTVKEANDALGDAVGVKRPATTATTTVDRKVAGMLSTGLVEYLRDATGRIDTLMRGPEGQDDAVVAARLLDLEKLIRASLGMIDRIGPATDEESMALAALDDTLQTLDGDLGSLSSSIGAHRERAAARTGRELALHLRETTEALAELDAVVSRTP